MEVIWDPGARRTSAKAAVKVTLSDGSLEECRRYDEGGFSGGTLDRPALKRLLEDITAGKIDAVLIYKIDRLMILSCALALNLVPWGYGWLVDGTSIGNNCPSTPWSRKSRISLIHPVPV
jgi:hypothetical protein